MTTLHKPIQRHSNVALSWSPVRISFFFGEHENGGLGEVEPIEEQVFHAVGVIDTTLELVPGVPVGNTADDGPLAAVDRGRGAGRGVVVRRWSHGWCGPVRVVVGGRWRWWWWWWWLLEAARLGYAGDGMADGAADGLGAWRELQWRVAV